MLLELPQNAPAWNLRELVTWWARSFGHRYATADRMHRRLEAHVLAELGELPCAELTAEVIELRLSQLFLGPQALNHIRSDLRRCIRAAKGSRRWPWDDPTEYVKPRPVPSRAWRVLSNDECRALLWGALPQHLVLFACALYAGLRKGELLALRVGDVDLAGRRIYVRRSRKRDTTKTGRARVVPVCDELAMYLSLQLRALDGLGSALVFPGRDGVSMRNCDAKLARSACAALWRGGVPLSIRFQDLRHTCSTRLRRAGVDRDLVGAVLGHQGKSTTCDYTHWSEADLLDAVNRAPLGAPRRMPC